MGKFVLKHEGVEYHFHFGRHRFSPGEKERINADEIDALVLEEGIKDDSQTSKLVSEVKAQKKPVYYVESEQLNQLADVMAIGGFSILGGGVGLKLGLKRKLTRREFLAGLLPSVSALLLLTDFGRTLPNVISAPSEKREYTKEELDKLSKDVKSGIVIAKRNAVIAEALTQLNKKHKRLGVVVGAGHYNISDYILDEKLRKAVMGKYKPNIRKM